MSQGANPFQVLMGIVRTSRLVGQTYPKGSASAPMTIGARGGINVEGIENVAAPGDVSVTDVTATTVSSTLLAANPDRISSVIQNNGSTTVFLAFDTAAVAGSGITLPAGVYWEPETVFLGEITVITASSTSRVTALEAI